MVAENMYVQTSGTILGGTGSSTLSMTMLMCESGTGIFVPVNLGDLK